MLLAVDVGNTHSSFALCEAGTLRHHWRVATDPHRTEDELAVLLQSLMQQEKLSLQAIDDVIISSVVPDALFALRCFTERYCKQTAIVIGQDELPMPMRIEIDQPDELGADRLVNAYGAWAKHERALIVIDFGTATTFDVVNSQGAYVGGVIAPGVNLSLEALSQAAAKLHGIRIRKPDSAIGKNTTHAMQAGVYYGYLGLIKEIIAQIQNELPEADYVLATGGLAELYSRNNDKIHSVESNLTMEGLMRLYELQRKAA